MEELSSMVSLMEAEGEEILKSGAPPIEAVLCLCLTIINKSEEQNKSEEWESFI